MILGLCSSSALTNLILSITVLVCGRFLVSISSDHMTMVLQLRLQLCRSPGTSNPWTKVGCVVLIWFRCKKQHWCNDIHNATKNYSQRVGILLGPLSLGITYTSEMCSCIAPITLWHICHEEFFFLSRGTDYEALYHYNTNSGLFHVRAWCIRPAGDPAQTSWSRWASGVINNLYSSWNNSLITCLLRVARTLVMPWTKQLYNSHFYRTHSNLIHWYP